MAIRSRGPSAWNVPYADLGWLERGMAEAALEAAAFDTSVGDILVQVVFDFRGHLSFCVRSCPVIAPSYC